VTEKVPNVRGVGDHDDIRTRVAARPVERVGRFGSGVLVLKIPRVRLRRETRCLSLDIALPAGMTGAPPATGVEGR